MFRRTLIAAVAALGAFSISFAFAASMGGLSPDGLGADDGAVSSCDTDGVSASYSLSFDSTDGRYEVATVTISGISDDCDGKTLNVTVSDSSGNALASASATIASGTATSEAVSLSSAVSAASLANVHVAIS